MGAGASTAADQVKAASAEEIRTAVSELDAEGLAKLREALQAAATKGSGGAAPFLAQYFKKVIDRSATILDEMTPDVVTALSLDPEAQAKFKEMGKKFFNEELKPLLEKSFSHHDTSGNGVLEVEESKVFFGHFVDEQGEFTKAVSAETVRRAIESSMCMMQVFVPPEATEEFAQDIKKVIEGVTKDIHPKIDGLTDAYKADKAARDAAAFAVVDTSKDGKLQLTEFLAALDSETERGKAFQKALGFDDDSIEKAMQPQNGGTPPQPDCAQQ